MKFVKLILAISLIAVGPVSKAYADMSPVAHWHGGDHGGGGHGGGDHGGGDHGGDHGGGGHGGGDHGGGDHGGWGHGGGDHGGDHGGGDHGGNWGGPHWGGGDHGHWGHPGWGGGWGHAPDHWHYPHGGPGYVPPHFNPVPVPVDSANLCEGNFVGVFGADRDAYMSITQNGTNIVGQVSLVSPDATYRVTGTCVQNGNYADVMISLDGNQPYVGKIYAADDGQVYYDGAQRGTGINFTLQRQ